MEHKQNVCVLGSTGSVGVNTLDVISRQLDNYCVFALSANKNHEKLFLQCQQYEPKIVVMNDPQAAENLRSKLRESNSSIHVLHGEQALCDIAAHQDIDIVMAAIVGSAGLHSTLAAIKAAKKVLIANKEPLIMAGKYMLEAALVSGAKILPVDSEHNAIMQCLPSDYCAVNNNKTDGIKRILLTGSGGPFRQLPLDEFNLITPAQACAHPNWVMGPKISVDSATMMNKALELIEACLLFGVEQNEIDIVVHPQSVIHSMVEYQDGSVVAQMGSPDMRIPIASALAWPQRIESGAAQLDFLKISALEFELPDLDRYPSLNLVRQVIESGGTAPAIMNAANEVAVEAFLQNKIKFTQIIDLVEKSLDKSNIENNIDLESVINADRQTRVLAERLLGQESVH